MKPKCQRLVLFSLATLLAAPLQAGLIHHYKFDETSGTVADDFVGTEDGAIGASVAPGQPARLGTSFLFPATAGDAASRVTLPIAVSPTGVATAFTMTAFVNLANPLGNGGQMHIISGNHGAAGRWSLMFYDSDAGGGVTPSLTWFHNGGLNLVNYTTAPISNTPGEWVHVGITRDATGLTRLYLNGVGQDIGTSTGSLASTEVGIGERPNAAQYQFGGRIDDVRFYDSALLPVEMAALAAETADTDNDGLPDDWEDANLGTRNEDGDDDHDMDGYNNRVEFLANTDPDDDQAFPMGNTDGDSMDDGWEWINFETLSRDGFGDFDSDGSFDVEEFQVTSGLLVTRNPNGSVASVTSSSGSTDPKNPDSQPNFDSDALPDGYEILTFMSFAQDGSADFDSDTFSDEAEFLANSNPARLRSTPANVHLTSRIAVTDNSGVSEYSVTDRIWTFVKQIVAIPGGVFGVTGHSDDYLYATTLETPPRVIRINPASGAVTTLATRAEGDAATAGWNASNPQGIEIGPDGKIYFSTSFGGPAGEGVFRLNTDGSGFESFIARTGGTAPNDWVLNNARDLEWDGSILYVSSRNSNAIYQFDSAGVYVSTFATVTNVQGLATEEDGLLATTTANGFDALVLMDTAATAPVFPSSRGVPASLGGMDAIDLNGDIYTVTYSTNGVVGQVFLNGINTNPTVAVAALPDRGNDLVAFTSSLVSDPYNDWATGQGIDPFGPNGGPDDDFEGDGTSNRVEMALGLDPQSGSSRFMVTTSGTAEAGQTLTWPSQPGISFQVRSSTDLADWSTIEATVVGQAAMTNASWTAPAAAGVRKFYRVQFTP